MDFHTVGKDGRIVVEVQHRQHTVVVGLDKFRFYAALFIGCYVDFVALQIVTDGFVQGVTKQ